MKTIKLLLIGAAGFVGPALVCKLDKDECYQVCTAVCYRSRIFSNYIEQVLIGDLNAKTNCLAALNGVKVVIRAAARARVLVDDANDPLVYEPNAPENFVPLVQCVDKGIILPLGSVCNQRSFTAWKNLVGFITCCIEHPKAANEIFFISDGKDVSTTELLQKEAMLPVAWFVVSRYFKASELQCWEPVVTMDEELKKMVEADRETLV